MTNIPARILVTDDDALALRAVTHLLRSAGYVVFSAANGEQTLQLVEKHHPDMMLLDVVLPDIDGTEICRRIKADTLTEDIFVILLSGLRTHSDEQSQAMEDGANSYIARPIANRELLARIQAYLRVKTAEQKLKENVQCLEKNIAESKRVEVELRRAKKEIEVVNLELQQSLANEKILARTDGLTRLYNHRHFFELATREFHASMRHQNPLTFMMFDMDGFKQINDTLGHRAGDKLLIKVAETAAAQVRAFDVAARYGGDEFIIMLPHTGTQQAFLVAERIRKSVAASLADMLHNEQTSSAVTLSIGIADACFHPMDKNVECVIQRADEALYTAKQSGRNRTVVLHFEDKGESAK